MTHVYDNTITIFQTYHPKHNNLSKHIMINTYSKLIYCTSQSFYVSFWNQYLIHMMMSPFLTHYSFNAIMSFNCFTSTVSRVWSHSFLSVFVPLENFSLMWRRHHYRWRAAHFDLYSALMAIEQWGFFSVPHLLWHGHPFIMVISEDPWHSHLLPSV